MLFYFLFHLFFSERSVPNLWMLTAQEKSMAIEMTALEKDYDALNKKVAGLRPETLNPDLVEEYAIKMLGYGYNSTITLVE